MLVNLTPHTIVLIDPSGKEIQIPSSGIARTSSTPGELRSVEGIPVPVADSTVYGDVVGLPEPRENVWLIVSAIVGSALRGSRPDVLCPGTGPSDGAVRDSGGRIIGVTRLVRA